MLLLLVRFRIGSQGFCEFAALSNPLMLKLCQLAFAAIHIDLKRVFGYTPAVCPALSIAIEMDLFRSAKYLASPVAGLCFFGSVLGNGFRFYMQYMQCAIVAVYISGRGRRK